MDRQPTADVAVMALDAALQKAQDDCPVALGDVFEAARKYLLTIANRQLDIQLRAKVGASDLVQDTFVEAQRDFEKFNGTTFGEFRRWLTAILEHRLANNVRRYRRTQKRQLQRELTLTRDVTELARLQDAAPTPRTALIAEFERQRVKEAIERLPPDAREIIIDRNWRRLSFAEIGVRHRCSAEAARKRWSRAVVDLQKRLVAGEVGCASACE